MDSNVLPITLERKLEFMGVLKTMPEYTKMFPDTDARHNYTFRKPNFDENGEPDF
jgi:hypothetical protein